MMWGMTEGLLLCKELSKDMIVVEIDAGYTHIVIESTIVKLNLSLRIASTI